MSGRQPEARRPNRVKIVRQGCRTTLVGDPESVDHSTRGNDGKGTWLHLLTNGFDFDDVGHLVQRLGEYIPRSPVNAHHVIRKYERSGLYITHAKVPVATVSSCRKA